MAEFKVISTQEEFDAAIQSRLERERTKVRAEFGDYDAIKSERDKALADLETERGKSSGFETTIAELTGKVKQYETDSAKTRIAAKYGLAPELCGRLNGTTEEEIDADAKILAQIVGPRIIAPKYNPANNIEEDKTGYAELARSLTPGAE